MEFYGLYFPSFFEDSSLINIEEEEEMNKWCEKPQQRWEVSYFKNNLKI